jgi:hypothetical protein
VPIEEEEVEELLVESCSPASESEKKSTGSGEGLYS